MKKRFVMTLATVAALLVGAQRARADVINFEGLASGTVVTNQYAAQGVTFSGAQILTAGVSLNSSFPPQSGSNVVFDFSNGIITVTSANGWSSAGGYITGNTAITLDAFDSSNNLLGSVSTPGANYIGNNNNLSPNIFLNLSFANIAYVEFHDHGNSFTLDDFTFTSATPEPASLTMLGIGLFGMGGYALRRRKQAVAAAC
jgi:hypothetical protein